MPGRVAADAVERMLMRVLAETLMCLWIWAEPQNMQPALPEGALDSGRWFLNRHRACGPWPEIERKLADEIAARASSMPGWYWPAPDELLVSLRLGAWARVRVHVEVMDGLP